MASTTDIQANGAFLDTVIVEADMNQISIGGKTLTELQAAGTTVTITDSTITVEGYGNFQALTTGTVMFTADAALAAGTYTFTDNAGLTFTKVDLTAATAAIIATASDATTDILGGSGDDVLTGDAATTVLSGAAGNDILTAGALAATLQGGTGNDTLISGSAAVVDTLIGGTGADVFEVGTSSIVASDYSYSEGDVIKSTVGTTTLSDAGALSVNSDAVISTLSATDNAYKAKINDGTTTTEIWTAVTNQAVTLDGSAVTNSIVMNAATNAQGTTLVGGTGADSITSGLGADAIWGGAGNDSITLTTDTTAIADTVWFATGNGTDTVTGFEAGFEDTDDVVNLYDATLSDALVYDDGTSTAIRVGDSTMILTGVDPDAIIDLKVQEKSGTVKKAAFDLAGSQAFTVTGADDEADVYYGNGSALDYSGYTESGLKVDLYTDTAKYKGISQITASAVVGGTYIGSSNAATTIDASGATEANTIWGGSANADVISLNDTARDTVWFGATDGADSIMGSSYGYADTSDVIKLWDVTDLATVTFSDNGTTATITDGSAVLDTGFAIAATGANILVEDAAGTIKKVAFSADKSQAATIKGITVDGVADYVLGTKDITDTVTYDANLITDLTVNLQDSSVYSSIENINASGAAGNLTLIGAADVASAITAGAKNNVIWAGSSEDNAITLTVDAATNKDTIWYGGTYDGKDTVTNFGANDTVKFWDMSVAELATSGVTVGSAANRTFTFSTSNILELDALGAAATSINIKDKNDTSVKVQIGAAVATDFTYDDTTKIYFGIAGVANTVSASEANATFYLDNGKATAQFGAAMTVNDIYFNHVTALDASGMHGDYTLIGSASVANTLTGGAGTTAMWGGGLSNTAMVGDTAGVDTVWFGSGDGMDTFTNAGATDKIVLWNTVAIADLTATYDGTNGLTIATSTGDHLAITAGAADDFTSLTFQVGTSNTAATYTYDTENKSFKAKV